MFDEGGCQPSSSSVLHWLAERNDIARIWIASKTTRHDASEPRTAPRATADGPNRQQEAAGSSGADAPPFSHAVDRRPCSDELPSTRAGRIADAILLLAIAAILLLVSYGTLVFPIRLTGIGEYVVFYGLPGSLVLLLALALRLRESRKVNLVLVLASAVFVPYALEAILGVLDRPALNRTEAGGGFDSRTPLKVIEDLEKEGINAIPRSCPAKLFLERGYRMEIDGRELFPLGSISNAYTVLCNESGEYLSFESDEHGFRNPKGLYGAGSVDLLIVGDSFAYGECVPQGDDVAGLLRSVYPRTVNLGCSGNGPLIELASLKEYGKVLKPQVVLWFYYEGNDLTGMALERTNDILLKYLDGDHSQGLVRLQPEIDRKLVLILDEERKAAAGRGLDVFKFLVLNRTLRRFGLHRSRWATGDLVLFRRVIEEARDFVSALGGRLYFVFLPEWQRFKNPQGANADREDVLRLMTDLGVSTIDIYPVFVAHDEPLSLFPFHKPGHYNAVGQRVTAAAILRFLSEEGEDPW